MAEGRIDPTRLALPKLVPDAPWGKDEVTSDNNIPLSPQWLYSKPGESKPCNLVVLGDTRHSNSSLPHSSSIDFVQKDSVQLDGSQDKKDWKRNVPDIQNSRSWRDEERETGSLSRRERRKDGDRVNEYRKNDRRADNISVKDLSESRNLPSSDRRQEVTGRNSSNDSRRDSKWSSRWGPEDKEKDLRADKRCEADKEDLCAEKQSFLGSIRPIESDSRDKWRPRHRQEVHSGRLTVNRAAPGFGLDRGRAEGSNAGFAPGRGRASILGGSSQAFAASGGPIGAAPLSRSEDWHGKCGFSVNTFHYPRRKLLDIYRKCKKSDFDIIPEGLVDAPPLTQSKFVSPLAFVSPDAEEEALFDDILKGKVSSNESTYSITTELHSTRIDGSETETVTVNPVVSSTTTSHDGACHIGNGDTANIFFEVKEFGDNSLGISDDAVEGPIQTEPMLVFGEKNVVNGCEFLEDPYKDSMFTGKMSSLPFSGDSVLPDNSNSLLDISFSNEIPMDNEYDGNSGEVKISERASAPEELSLLYCDPQGDIQGPFLGVDIISWFEQGFFSADLPVCLADAPEGTPFQPLGELMPNLKLRSSSNAEVCPDDQSGPLNTASDSFEAEGSLASSFGNSLLISDQILAAAISKPLVDYQSRHRVSHFKDYSEHLQGRVHFIEMETSAGIPSRQDRARHDFVAQDAEEVLYAGRSANTFDNPTEKSANHFHDPSCGDREIEHTRIVDHKNISNGDTNPLGWLLSELEGSTARRPLSSNLISFHDQTRNAIPAVGLDYEHNQQDLNLIANRADAHDSWPGSFLSSNSSNLCQDLMVATSSPYFEARSNRFSAEEQLLSQHQKQVKDSVCHQSPNHSVDFEHLLKLQIQEQHHLQQLLEQQEMLQRRQQLHHQMQLLKQQQQEEQHKKMLFEKFLHQQLHEQRLAASHVDPLCGSLDQVLLRKRLLNDLEQRTLHLRLHQDPMFEQLVQEDFGQSLHRDHQNDLLDVLPHMKHRCSLSTDEQILLNLQQEQLQAKTGIASGAWSADQSARFVRTANDLYNLQSNRHKLLQQPSYKEWEQLERSRMLHELMQHTVYERNKQPFERKASLSRNPSGPNADVLHALPQLHVFDVPKIQDHLHPSMQARQLLPTANNSLQHYYNQQSSPHIDAMDGCWTISNGQLPHSVETQMKQFHVEPERHHWVARESLLRKSSSTMPALSENENSNHGINDLSQQNLGVESFKPSELESTSAASFENQNLTWPFTRSSNKNSFHPTTDTSVLGDCFTEASFDKPVHAQQERMVNSNMDVLGLSPLHLSSTLSIEQNRLVPEVHEIDKGQASDSADNVLSRDKVDLSGVTDGNLSRTHSLKGKALNNIDDLISGRVEMKANGPIRHNSLGMDSNGENCLKIYSDNVAKGTHSRSMRILERGAESSALNRIQDPFNHPASFLSSEEIRRESGVDHSSLAVPVDSESSILRDARFQQTLSSSEADASEASYTDIMKSTKKPAAERAAHSTSHDHAQSGSGTKSGKKKGKKGRQIDPSLLGFKVHSNRILMGEIQRPDV
ncbi:hypothetical protein AXF42_Ash000659 [Apostasia shenzhenica]|uniref:GYF domain-containing protein n=1 Tax=Apostasia shenzhenica TaxID=1088818 RepID=A0A2I0AH04_9ASPA|nr:hypothetical protein AXF42_Ash000659 [Apostasia shenzhenica]